MEDPASVLAPPPGWTPNQPSGDLPSTISAPLPTQITPPVSVSTAAPGQVDTINAPQSTQMLQPQQASTDPEVIAGHAHQSWLGHIMDVVGSILGGDKTIHITKSPDGTMTVTHDPSTTGEKWSRVAQAALMGGAAGLAHGQGPGGAANAIAAGVQTGAALPQQQLTQANQEATAANQQLVAKANMARLNQMVTMGTMEMRQKGIQMTDDEVNRANNNASYLLANPANRRLGEITDMSQLPSFAAKNADLISQHANGQIHTQTEIGDDGKPHVGVYLVDQNWMDQKNDKPYNYSRLAPGKTLKDPMGLEDVTIPVGAHKNSELMATHEAEDAKITAYKLKQDEINQKGDKIPTTGPGATVAGYLETDPARRAALLSAGKTIAQQEINKAVAGRQAAAGVGALPGATAAASAGTTGEDYLKAAVDPSMWNQVRAIANGDMKMPTAGMRGANQALRNAVMNFDPTYTDARYDTKQNFKTKGDATSVAQLSTAMAHADRALTNSAALGLSPSLATGRNLSGTAAAYNANANFFTGEAGKLVMGGIVGEQEGQRIRNNISSPVQSIRDDALREVLRLTGGKVGALVQKYKIGTQQDLPAHVFFDQPTQDLLNRYRVYNPGQEGTTDGSTATPTPPSTTNTTPTTPTPKATDLVTVQIPGSPPGHIPRNAVAQFKHDHPNGQVF